MARFILSRLFQSLVVLVGIYTLVFVLMKLSPGSPFAGEKAVPAHVLERMRSYYGLDQPLPAQWWRGLSNYLFHLDGGIPLKKDGFTVNEIIAESLPVSAVVGGVGLLFALGTGIPLGVYAAARKNRVGDYVASSLALVGICLPTFVIAPLAIAWCALDLGWFAPVGWDDPRADWILPSLVLGLFYMGYIARITRGGMLEALNQDYIRTALSKGLSEGRVLFVHALRHGLLPLVSYLGPATAGILAGSFVVETVFGLPGLGMHTVAAARDRDQPLLTGSIMTYGVLVLFFNFLSDIVQYWMNPRLRGGGLGASL